MKAGVVRPVLAVVVALALAAGGFGAYQLVAPGESAPETASLFPPSIPHKPVPVPLTEPVEWGPFRLLPVGWPAKDYQVVRPPEVEAKIAGQQRRETTDQASLTNSALFQRYLGGLALPRGYVLDAAEGIAFGDEVTWLMVTYMKGELMLRMTLYPYIQPPFESNVPYDVTWEMATINGYKVVVDLVEPLPGTRAFIRALHGNVGVFVEGDLEDILVVAQQVLR